ncbi:hypothetical protein [Streptomyces sp. NPDC048277]
MHRIALSRGACLPTPTDDDLNTVDDVEDEEKRQESSYPAVCR